MTVDLSEFDVCLAKFGGLRIYKNKPTALGKIIKLMIKDSPYINKKLVYLFFVNDAEFELNPLKWNHRWRNHPMYSVSTAESFTGPYHYNPLTEALDGLHLMSWEGVRPLIIVDSNDNTKLLETVLKDNYKVAMKQ